MDTIDKVFKNYLGKEYGYTLKYSSGTYKCDVFSFNAPASILVHTEDRLKTVCFAKAIASLLTTGLSALQSKSAAKFSNEFDPKEFPST